MASPSEPETNAHQVAAPGGTSTVALAERRNGWTTQKGNLFQYNYFVMYLYRVFIHITYLLTFGVKTLFRI